MLKQGKWMVLALVCASLMLGCGSSESELEDQKQEQTKRVDPLSTQKEALEKAKAVEGQMMQRKDDIDKALDRQEQADPEASVPSESPQAVRLVEARQQFQQEMAYAEEHFAMQQMHSTACPTWKTKKPAMWMQSEPIKTRNTSPKTS